MSQQKPHFSPHSKAKPIIKAQISGKLVNSGDHLSTLRETRMMKMFLIIIIIISLNKSQESIFFSRAPEIDFRYVRKARKVMVDFKFDAR